MSWPVSVHLYCRSWRQSCLRRDLKNKQSQKTKGSSHNNTSFQLSPVSKDVHCSTPPFHVLLAALISKWNINKVVHFVKKKSDVAQHILLHGESFNILEFINPTWLTFT